MIRRVWCWIVMMILLSACASTAMPQTSLFQNFDYVVSGNNENNGFANNALTIFDAKAMTIQHKVALPLSRTKSFSRDPRGNLWIGFSGNMTDNDDRVQIYSAQGELLKTIQPCVNPEAGISFAAARAFIVCAENGLSGEVAAVNLDTLKTELTLTLGLPNAPYLLITSAASETTVVVAGLTSGPEETSYSVISLIDPQTLTVTAQIPLGKNTDIWRILPHNDRFYLLNAGSYRQPRDQANDILILTPGSSPVITPQALTASPLWGAFDGNVLYVYHNSTWNHPIDDPHRQMSRLDMDNGQLQTWTLPDQWEASDLTIINGEIILAKWEYWSGDTDDGLYRFDRSTGQLSLLLNIADASSLLPPH